MLKAGVNMALITIFNIIVVFKNNR